MPTFARYVSGSYDDPVDVVKRFGHTLTPGYFGGRQMYERRNEPRFSKFQLNDLVQRKFGSPGESCLVLPTRSAVSAGRRFLEENKLTARQVTIALTSSEASSASKSGLDEEDVSDLHYRLYALFFTDPAATMAKAFWQHTGMGISSRMAARLLELLGERAGVSRFGP
jgi:hypothetical protein